MCNFSDALDIAHLHHGVGRSLKENHLGVRLNCFFNIFKIKHIDIGNIDSVYSEDVFNDSVRAAVQIVA